MHHQARHKQRYLHKIRLRNERSKMTHQQILIMAPLTFDTAAGRLDVLSQPVSKGYDDSELLCTRDLHAA